MKFLMILILIASLSSCTTLSKGGKAFCAVEVELSTTINEFAKTFGLPGTTFAGVLTAGLRGFCAIVDAVLSAPQDLTDSATGMFTGEKDATTPGATTDPGR